MILKKKTRGATPIDLLMLAGMLVLLGAFWSVSKSADADFTAERLSTNIANRNGDVFQDEPAPRNSNLNNQDAVNNAWDTNNNFILDVFEFDDPEFVCHARERDPLNPEDSVDKYNESVIADRQIATRNKFSNVVSATVSCGYRGTWFIFYPENRRDVSFRAVIES